MCIRDGGIALTKRGKHLGADIPMCGVPVHAAEQYLQKLIRLEHRVAVCEQMEDPQEAKRRGGKAVVRRSVIRLVTPGTLTEDTLLESRTSNYISALALNRGTQELALAWADISSGEFSVLLTDSKRLAAGSSKEAVVGELGSEELARKPAGVAVTLAWSPDGQRIIYMTWNDEEMGAIRVFNIATGTSEKLSKEKGIYRTPSFSPDGNRIIFRANFEGSSQIYAVDIRKKYKI